MSIQIQEIIVYIIVGLVVLLTMKNLYVRVFLHKKQGRTCCGCEKGCPLNEIKQQKNRQSICQIKNK